jgi:hypothetical protein
MFGLTEGQRKLYDKLQNIITDRGNVAGVLQGVSKNDLLTVLATRGTTIEFKNGERNIKNLPFYAVVIKNQEGLKAILNAMREKGITFIEMQNSYTINSPNFVKFDDMPPKKEQIEQIFLNAFKESDNLKKLLVELCIDQPPEDFNQDKLEEFVAIFGKDSLKELKAALRETGFDGVLDQILQYETRMAANKAMKIGIAFSAIAALAVGVGCFAAGVQLPILAIAGIVVAAASLVGLIAGSLTYAVSKPNGKVEEANAQGQGLNKVPA